MPRANLSHEPRDEWGSFARHAEHGELFVVVKTAAMDGRFSPRGVDVEATYVGLYADVAEQFAREFSAGSGVALYRVKALSLLADIETPEPLPVSAPKPDTVHYFVFTDGGAHHGGGDSARAANAACSAAGAPRLSRREPRVLFRVTGPDAERTLIAGTEIQAPHGTRVERLGVFSSPVALDLLV